jgi:hypothetical protein
MVRDAFDARNVVAGAFRTWTIADIGPNPLGPFLHVVDVRSRYTRYPYGDQSFFVEAAVFRQVGGFPSTPILEDVGLVRKVRKLGRVARVPASVQVSGRRFLARPVYYTVVMSFYPALYRWGVNPERLARWYGHPR